MLITLSTGTLKRTKWHQFAVRFAFGGAITLVAGLIAKKFGASVGGLFLAFPAIFPAAATLAQTHEEEKKQEQGLDGEQRGILAAADQSRGTALGSLGLIAFALLFWLLVPTMGLAILFPLALISWFGVAALAWFAQKRVHCLRSRPAENSKRALPSGPNTAENQLSTPHRTG